MAEESILDLFNKVNLSPWNYDLLHELIMRSNEILTFIKHNECWKHNLGQPITFVIYDAWWAREIMSTLVLSKERALVMIEARKEEMQKNIAVGKRFSELRASLPDHLRDLSAWFSACLPVPDSVQQDINLRGDLFACPEYRVFLSTRGIGPREFFTAVQAVVDFLDRAVKNNLAPDLNNIVVEKEWLVEEVAIVCRYTFNTAEALLRWFYAVAVFQPEIFPGYYVRLTDRAAVTQKVFIKIATEDKK